MSYNRKRPPLDPCPVEAVLAIVAGKWKVRVLYLLSLGELTFGELRKSIGGIRQQVLATLLRELEADAVVTRIAVDGGSRYRLTAKGFELVALLTPLASWCTGLLAEQGLAWTPPVRRGNGAAISVA